MEWSKLQSTISSYCSLLQSWTALCTINIALNAYQKHINKIMLYIYILYIQYIYIYTCIVSVYFLQVRMLDILKNFQAAVPFDSHTAARSWEPLWRTPSEDIWPLGLGPSCFLLRKSPENLKNKHSQDQSCGNSWWNVDNCWYNTTAIYCCIFLEHDSILAVLVCWFGEKMLFSASRPAVEGGFYYDMYLGTAWHRAAVGTHRSWKPGEQRLSDANFQDIEKAVAELRKSHLESAFLTAKLGKMKYHTLGFKSWCRFPKWSRGDSPFHRMVISSREPFLVFQKWTV